jgi:O-antigen/teichoic acid export membrane protein
VTKRTASAAGSPSSGPADVSDIRPQARRIAYGAAVRLAGRASGALVSLVALREATRYFGPAQWGSVTAAVAWFSIFAVLGGPGVATLTMREVADPAADARSAFGRGLAATVAVSVTGAILAAAVGVGAYWGKGDTLAAVLVLTAGVPLAALFATSGSVLAGRGRSDARAALDLSSSALLLCYLAASAAVAVGVAWIFLRPALRLRWTALRRQIRSSLPLGQFDVFAAAYARADSIMLFFIRGERPVALYGVAFQVATFLFVIPSLLSNALLPDFMGASDERRQFLSRRCFDVILTVALPLPVFGVLFARPFVVWIAGEGFAGAGSLLAILTGAAAVALLNGFLYQMAIFAGAEKGLWRAIGVVTAVNLAANAVAVTVWGAPGAAAVMILSEAVGLVAYWRIYRAKMPSPLGRRYPASVAVAVAGLVGACAAFHAGLGLGPGGGKGIVPRAAGLLALYLVLLWAAATAARKLSRTARRDPGTRDAG